MVSKWKDDVTSYQQLFHDLMSGNECDSYDVSGKEGKLVLYKNIGFAFFGVPDEEPKYSNEHTGYGGPKLETIKKTAEAICSASSNKRSVDLAVVFAFVNCKDGKYIKSPVFRVHTGKYSRKFVCSELRIYSSWDDYFNNNHLPAGDGCWPVDGRYSADKDGKVVLCWEQTPAARPMRTMLRVADSLSVGAALGSTVVFGASMLTLPVAAPVMAAAGVVTAATGVYSVARGVGTLTDRGVHEQTLNPAKDLSVMSPWLSVIGGTIGLGASIARARAVAKAQNGKVSQADLIAVNALSVASITINGVGVVHRAIFIKQRYDADQLTALDVFQFSASVLFFMHAVVNFQTASQIVRDSEVEAMVEFERNLRGKWEKSSQYDELIKSGRGGCRTVRTFISKDEFFSSVSMENVLTSVLQRDIPDVKVTWEDVTVIVTAVDKLVDMAATALNAKRQNLWRPVLNVAIRNVDRVRDTYGDVKSISKQVTAAVERYSENKQALINDIRQLSMPQ